MAVSFWTQVEAVRAHAWEALILGTSTDLGTLACLFLACEGSHRDLCLILRIGRNQAYWLVNSGRLGPCRIGSSIRIPKAAVERLLQSQTLQPLVLDGGVSQ